jgi:hypothetical protein
LRTSSATSTIIIPRPSQCTLTQHNQSPSQKLNHSAQILSLTAGAQYRHRKTIQRANETFGTVRSLRHKLSLDEKALEESERKRLEQWIKDHPPKHGVENRPVWDNDFTNPESSDLNARDTKKAVEEARSKSFRGTVGPGYGVDLNAVPEGFGMGTNVDGFTLNGVEKALDEVRTATDEREKGGQPVPVSSEHTHNHHRTNVEYRTPELPRSNTEPFRARRSLSLSLSLSRSSSRTSSN